jgi:hypothetical protein
MTGDIAIAAIRVFQILAWVSAATVIATVIFLQIALQKSVRDCRLFGLISLALAVNCWSVACAG